MQNISIGIFSQKKQTFMVFWVNYRPTQVGFSASALSLSLSSTFVWLYGVNANYMTFNSIVQKSIFLIGPGVNVR